MNVDSAFYITFWLVIIALTIFALIYVIFSYEKLGGISDLSERVTLLEARDFLQWSAILLGIAVLFLVLVLGFIVAYGFNDVYEIPAAVCLLYIGFLVWFLVTLVLLIVAYERLGSSADILQLTDVQIARRDLFVTLAGVATISALLTLGYFGYVYKVDNFYTC